MKETDSKVGIVETLRNKSEKEDINKYLKTTLGGFTKSSVLEYLGVMRRQQQATAEIFSQNQQTLFEEKEKLGRDNEALKMRLGQVEAEYKNLSEAARTIEADGGTESATDSVALKKNIAALEEELTRLGIVNSRLDHQIGLQADKINDDGLKLSQADQEVLSLKEMLKAEKMESKKQRSTVAQLSGTIEEKNEEIKFLKQAMSESELIDFKSRIHTLTQQLTEQTEVVANSNNENSLKSVTIKTLAQENETLKQSIAKLSKTLEELSLQNDKLMLANTYLSEQLETEYKRALSLIKEKSGAAIDKLSAVRCLDEANMKIIMLELQLKDYETSKATSIVYDNIDQKLN